MNHMTHDWTITDPPLVRIARFFSRIEKTDTCWLWRGHHNLQGYGTYSNNQAHRLCYEFLVGPIPDGMQLDHLCRVRDCVNPDHLEPVTNRENAQRGNTGKATGAKNAAKTHCKWGHAYDEANTYHYINPRGSNARACRACLRDRARAQRARRKR